MMDRLGMLVHTICDAVSWPMFGLVSLVGPTVLTRCLAKFDADDHVVRSLRACSLLMSLSLL